MIEFPISDSEGNSLLLVSGGNTDGYDAVTCSPQPDGFTVLNSLLGRSVPKPTLEAACRETVSRSEVCVLQKEFSARWRVLLTPTLRSFNSDSRREASRLMSDLFRATQAEQVRATQLLITHFAFVREYPEPHVEGIFDALNDLKNVSFLGLQKLGFDIASNHQSRFERHLSRAFAV